MAETEASPAHAVDEDGKTCESNSTETQQTANKTADQSDATNTEVANSKDTVNKEAVEADGAEAATTAETAETAEAGEAAATAGEGAPADTSEGTTAATEPKTSLLDSFLHKSGLGKVMGGRKKKEPSTAAEDPTTDGGDKDGEKNGEEAEGAAEGQASAEKEPDSVEKEDDKHDKSKTTEAKSTVRDLIRKPVARIFSHRSTEKKDGTAGEPQKQVKVRSKSLDRIEDPEALNTTADPSTEESGAAGGAEEEGEHKASSSAQAKHMKRWHSFKKMMAQKTHKKSSGGGEDGKEEGLDGDGAGGDSSTLDSKESGQKRWKLKRSWTFQGMKRDPSVVGISSKAKSSDKDLSDTLKAEEGGGEAGGEEAKAEGGAEGPCSEGGDEEKAPAAGVGAVTQHANEIWTSFKKRVIPKSKRTNTECAPAEEDGAAGEEGSSEEGKDGKSAKAKRSHFGRAVSLKNFILRKGKSTSVDAGEGAKEEEGAPDGEEANAESAADGEAAPTAEGSNAQPADGEATAKSPEDDAKSAEKTPEETPVTNCENGCTNGTEDDGPHNHQENDTTNGSSPIKKSKVAGSTKDEANTKIINTTAPGDSGELEPVHLETEQPQSSSSSSERDGATNSRAQPSSDRSNLMNGREQGGVEREGYSHLEEGESITKGHIREAAVAIVQNVMSAAANQLERELCT